MELVNVHRTVPHSVFRIVRRLLVANIFIDVHFAISSNGSVSGIAKYPYLHYNKIARRPVIKIIRSSTDGRLRRTIASHAYAQAHCRHRRVSPYHHQSVAMNAELTFNATTIWFRPYRLPDGWHAVPNDGGASRARAPTIRWIMSFDFDYIKRVIRIVRTTKYIWSHLRLHLGWFAVVRVLVCAAHFIQLVWLMNFSVFPLRLDSFTIIQAIHAVGEWERAATITTITIARTKGHVAGIGTMCAMCTYSLGSENPKWNILCILHWHTDSESRREREDDEAGGETCACSTITIQDEIG